MIHYHSSKYIIYIKKKEYFYLETDHKDIHYVIKDFYFK